MFTFDLNQLVAGIAPALANDQAVMMENLWARIQATDASGKLQVLALYPSLLGFGVLPAQTTSPLPFTFPALNNTTLYSTPAYLPVPSQLGQDASGIVNGNLLTCRYAAIVVNTDTVAHTYLRTLACSYRIISGVDPTSGPSIPGSGISPE